MEVTRRQFLTRFGHAWTGSLTATATSPPGSTTDSAPETSPWVRPPGALPSGEFLATCTRCAACQEACPHGAIRRLGPEFGAQAGTPAVIPTESPCYLCPDTPCILACEPRALLPAARADISMGTAVLKRSACYVAKGQPCEYCVIRCPLGRHAITFGHDGLPTVIQEGCSGCGVCAYLCPADAITVVPNEAV